MANYTKFLLANEIVTRSTVDSLRLINIAMTMAFPFHKVDVLAQSHIVFRHGESTDDEDSITYGSPVCAIGTNATANKCDRISCVWFCYRNTYKLLQTDTTAIDWTRKTNSHSRKWFGHKKKWWCNFERTETEEICDCFNHITHTCFMW